MIGDLQLGLPDLACPPALTAGRAPWLEHLIRNLKWRCGPAHSLAGIGDLIVKQGVAVTVRVAFLGSRALGDQGLAGNEGRSILLGRPTHGGGHLGVIMAVDGLDRPAIGLEPRHLIASFGNGGHTVDSRVVVVKEDGKLGQPEPTSDRRGLVTYALHQTAITGNHPGAVIDQILAKPRSQVPLCHGQANGGCDSLTQRPRRRLHPRRVAIFWVTGRIGAPLTEILDLLHRHRLEPCEVQKRIDQH